MFFATKIEDCCGTVIAAMASHIEQLQSEIHFKQCRIDELTRQNEELRAQLEDKAAERSGTLCEIGEEARTRFNEILQSSTVQL